MAEPGGVGGMAASAVVPLPALVGYGEFQLLQTTGRHHVFRGRRADGHPVVVKVLKNIANGDALASEHALLLELCTEPGVVNTLELIRGDTACALVMEDAGHPLTTLIAQHAPHLRRTLSPHAAASGSSTPGSMPTGIAGDYGSLARRLELAVAIAAALEQIHARYIVHLDIKPHNVLVDAATGRVALCDFGSAVRLSSTSSSPASIARGSSQSKVNGVTTGPVRMVGSPPYMAPEQTGRTTGGVDARTDLYGFGVLLYQLFTFRLPFECGTASEYIQAHLARAPPPPRRALPSLPTAIDAIIMKLLSKDKDRRYESAHGVKVDLEHCLAELTATGIIPDTLLLGARDRSGALRAPQQLWGREPELARLVAVMAAARAGGRVCALVDGPSGVGKSSLIEEARRRVNGPHQQATTAAPAASTAVSSGTSNRVVVATGKGEQARRVPYGTLDQAVAQLVASLQMEGHKTVESVRNSLRASLGVDASVLGAALPSVHSLLGVSEETTLNGEHAHARFSSALQRFFHCIVSAERTCILYIDDIQWCDESTLRSLDSLLGSESLTHFMVICAYRTQELPPTLYSILTSAEGFLRATANTVAGLTQDDVAGLIGDMLGASASNVTELAAVCAERTGGNPLHVMEVLRFLHTNHLLSFDAVECAFKWDIKAVRSAVTSTPDVAEMVLQRMAATLSGDSAKVVSCGALLGAQFSSEVVQRATGLPASTVRAALQAAVSDGIVEHYLSAPAVSLSPATPAPVAVTGGDSASSHENMGGDECFRFLHDRIHEAASRLQPENLAALHASVGILLLQRYQAQQDANSSHGKLVFEICDHLNAAVALGAVLDENVVGKLIELNMEATKAAHQLMTFVASKRYVDAAREHLQRRALNGSTASVQAAEDAMWAFDYGTALKLTVERISLAQQMDETDTADEALASGIRHARADVDRGKMLVSKIFSSVHKMRLAEGMEALQQALVYMGQPLPATNLDEFAHGLLDKNRLNDPSTVDRLIDLHLATGEYTDVLASVMSGGTMVAYLLDPRSPTFAAMCALTWDIVLQHGINAQFCAPLAMYCALLVSRGEYLVADRISNSIRELIRKYDFRAYAPEPLVLIAGLVHPWARPLKEGHAYLAEVVKIGREVGEYNFAGYAQIHDAWFNFVEGQHLAALMRTLPEQISFARSVKNVVTYPSMRVVMRVCAKLMRHDRFVSLLREHGETGITEDEAMFEKTLVISPYAEWTYLILTGIYHMIMDEPAEAIEYLNRAELKIINGVLLSILIPFMQIMAYARLHGTRISAEILAKLDSCRATLAKCAEAAPFNWGSMLALADAELMRVRGAPTSAVVAAVAGMLAREGAPSATRCPWLLGLAHETAARAWAQDEKLVFDYREFHLRSAIAAYREWGALAKAERVRRVPRNQLAASLGVSNPARTVTENTASVGDSNATVSVTKDDTTNTSDLDALFLLKGFQLISEELRADRVYDVALPVMAESSGAQHAIMVNVSEQGELTLEGKFSEDMRAADLALPPYMSLEVGARLTANDALLSLLHVTTETREPHIVEDAPRNSQYWNDPYVLTSRPRSVLCAPLLSRGKLTAILYMENNLYSGTFTKRQLTFVKILLNQVSISVENARLYARVEEDTRSLHGTVVSRDGEMRNAQATMKSAREGAALASQAQSAWLATMVHELRTPISNVISLAQQLLVSPISPDQRENLEIIRSSSDSLVKQVDDILVSSRREQPKLTLAPEATDLRRCFTDCCSVIRVQAAAKRLNLVLDLADDLPAVVLIDPLRVRQIVINLLGNAVKFTDQGSVTLRVSARQAGVRTDTHYDLSTVPPLAPWYELHCQVTDTGIGISSEGISRLFTAFEQVDSSVERRMMGTGLGLAISKNLTDLMGGRIWVESSPDRGSTFHFTLICPALPDDAVPSLIPTSSLRSGSALIGRASQSSPSMGATSSPDGGQSLLRVLVVDDSAINLKVLQKLLAVASPQVVTTLVGSGAEAVFAVRQSHDQPFDVIFMDVHMAGMDGAEAAHAIRRMDLAFQPRIVALTADTTLEDKADGARCFDAVLTKPLKLTDLMSALRTARFALHA